MSTRIRISYECEEELQTVINRLSPIIGKVKREPPKGRYMRAYADVQSIQFETLGLQRTAIHGIIKR